jgi:hypothetical protein
MSGKTDKTEEIERNLEFFLDKLPELKKQHAGKYALLRSKSIIGFFDTMNDAQLAGSKLYEDDLFSIQRVDEQPISLGYFSNAVHLASAQ